MNKQNETLKLAIELMKKPSITPNDCGCMPLLVQRLERFGFTSEIFRFEDVDNLWMKRGSQGPLFVFLGHTDVVPPGPLEAWKTDPFEPTVMENMLYGRGAVDMKGGIAAMVVAVERFLIAHSDFDGSIAFLLTSDEEGQAINGTRRAIDLLVKRQETINWCIVGEPSSSKRVGDVIRQGRRGSLSGDLLIKGIQGHVAYPHKVKNPIHLCAPFIQALTDTVWDRGNENFPPTSLQIVHIQAGTGTYNVVPGNLAIKFNFRYSPCVTAAMLQDRVIHELKSRDLLYEIHWSHSADPFLTPPGFLLEKTKEAVMEVMDFDPQFSTDGGTSDARFIAPLGIPVVELGLCNETLHQVNECVAVDDLEHLSEIYERLLGLLFVGQ